MNTPEKQCADCKQFFPATPDYFNRKSSAKDGLMSTCRVCRSTKRRKEYAETPVLRSTCRAKALEWYYAHLEHRKTRRKAYYHSDPQRFIRETADWKRRNPNRQKRHKRHSYIKHRDTYQAYGRERRARLHGLADHHTPADVRCQYKAQHGRCYYCGVKLHHKFEIDHVVPLSRGGLDTADNIVCACQFCNRSKGDKLVHEWGQSNRLL